MIKKISNNLSHLTLSGGIDGGGLLLLNELTPTTSNISHTDGVSTTRFTIVTSTTVQSNSTSPSSSHEITIEPTFISMVRNYPNTSMLWIDYDNTTFANSVSIKRDGFGGSMDGIKIQGRNGGSSGYLSTITPTTLTANRTVTMPDSSGTMILDSSDQLILAAQIFA